MKKLWIFLLLIFFVGCRNNEYNKRYEREDNKCIQYHYIDYEYEYYCDPGYTLYGQSCTSDDPANPVTVVANVEKICPNGYEPVEGILVKKCKKIIDELSID